jgi:ribonuclease R
MHLKFMGDKVGKEFEGPVRHMTAYGAYVELNPYGIEGFLPLENLKGDYQFEPRALLLKGRQGETIQYGDIMKVKVDSIDLIFQRLVLNRV